MWACSRGEAPEMLTMQGPALCAAYQKGCSSNPKHRFEWGAALREAIRAALLPMTQERCAYCDGDLRPATVQPNIDHFKPKSRPEFHELVCTWGNLFPACTPCNQAKGNRWDERLLKPDDLEYRFDRYFAYAYDTDKLEPNPVASERDQEQAAATIELLGLNGSRHCASRRRCERG
jgi:uncharacterized protein (TIGR02646 family)